MADLTALYSFQGQEPQPLPEKIRFSDGSTRTDASTFTDEELTSAGFTGPYSRPEYNPEYQRLHWDSEKLSFVIEDISEEELWKAIREKRNKLLLDTDWTMMPDAPQELNYHEWEMYRQRLRDLPLTLESPKNVIWPISPEGLSDDEFDQERIYESRLRWRVEDLESKVKELFDEINLLSQDTSIKNSADTTNSTEV
jgi:hypothetical protein